jgi:hypothetical protein
MTISLVELQHAYELNRAFCISATCSVICSEMDGMSKVQTNSYVFYLYPANWVLLHTSSKFRQMVRRALTYTHMSMTSGYATRHGQLRCRHTLRGTSSHLLARGSSGAATCPVTLAPESRLRCCHVSHGASFCHLAQGSSGAVTCPMAPAPAS